MSRAGRTVRPAYRVVQWAWRSLDWLFPPTCGGCNQPGDRWCFNCQQAVQPLSQLVCERCGQPVHKAGICAECRINPPSYQRMRSYAVYGGAVRNALHSLKYRKNVALGDVLSQYLVTMFASLDWDVDLLVPVPLSKQRYRERGYNQVGLIARPVAIAFDISYKQNALSRRVETASQVGLSGAIRRRNVVGAFLANASIVRGKRILLIDDIFTTGATMEACARALIDGGASQVDGLTLARSLLGTRSPLDPNR